MAVTASWWMSQSRQANHASTSSRDTVPSRMQYPFQYAVGCIFKGRVQCWSRHTWPVLSGVRVTRVVQAPGEYVITFPRAYHGGFSNGFCIGEAVNFSIGDWFPFGLDAAQRYRRLSRLPILAHDELLCLEGLAIHGKVPLMHSASVHVCVAFHVYDMCIADNNGKLLSFCMHRTAADALRYFADRLVSVLLPFCCFTTAKHQ